MRVIIAIIIAACPLMAFALSSGEVAQSSMGLLSFTSQLMLAAFSSICFGMFIGAFFKYRSYRQNPTETPLSTPVIWLLLAIGLLCLCLIIVYQNENANLSSAVPQVDRNQFNYIN